MQACGIITLTTDFGLEDEYVGLLKGVMLCREPNLRLIDLCHALPPGDIAAAARMLRASWLFFPPGTVHLAVVDPGVGGSREILALTVGDQFFVGPDNGIFSPWFNTTPPPQVRRVTNTRLFLPRISATFHGRDIMAPVAAALAGGLPLAETGPALAPEACVRLALSQAQRVKDCLCGSIVARDHFGNLLSDICREELAGLAGDTDALLQVEVAGSPALRLVRCYDEASVGEAIALVGSRGVLEIAVNRGNAARILGVDAGATVIVRRQAAPLGR
ncbi:MAG: hypothetical protein BWK76_21085 [Desulfobulbaceae bacterium A2]|nr:MAG: hypothetical protein BWK76_21085 [Desulfobulbaceae bacterium A2]